MEDKIIENKYYRNQSFNHLGVHVPFNKFSKSIDKGPWI